MTFNEGYMTNKKILTVGILLLTLATVSGCGIKGALDLPEDEAEQSSYNPGASY